MQGMPKYYVMRAAKQHEKHRAHIFCFRRDYTANCFSESRLAYPIFLHVLAAYYLFQRRKAFRTDGVLHLAGVL